MFSCRLLYHIRQNLTSNVVVKKQENCSGPRDQNFISARTPAPLKKPRCKARFFRSDFLTAKRIHSARRISAAQVSLPKIDPQHSAHFFIQNGITFFQPFRIFMYRRFAHAEMFGARAHGTARLNDIFPARDRTPLDTIPHSVPPAVAMVNSMSDFGSLCVFCGKEFTGSAKIQLFSSSSASAGSFAVSSMFTLSGESRLRRDDISRLRKTAYMFISRFNLPLRGISSQTPAEAST